MSPTTAGCADRRALVSLSDSSSVYHMAFIQRLLNPAIGRLAAVVGSILLKAIGAEDAVWFDLHSQDDAVAVIRCVLHLCENAY
jgi:hypothetical protein